MNRVGVQVMCVLMAITLFSFVEGMGLEALYGWSQWTQTRGCRAKMSAYNLAVLRPPACDLISVRIMSMPKDRAR